MHPLLKKIIEAHGGEARWRLFETVQATIVTGGALWAMKGLVQDPSPRRITVWLHEPRASLTPFGAADQKTVYTPERISIEKLDGEVVAERLAPHDAFAGHELTTPWDALHRAYFNGLAQWTYLTTPFLLASEGVEVSEIEPWTENGETWRRLRARFPQTITTHSRVQDFMFGDDFLLRRHDYALDVVGGFIACQYVYDYVEADGLRLPSRRRAYQRGSDHLPIIEPLMVSIDFTDIHFS